MLDIRLVRGVDLAPDLRESVYALCEQAYGEDLRPLFATFAGPTHLLGFVDNTLASHALWVTRWLQPGDGPLLRTAYVEMVATGPRFQGSGYATALMRRLAGALAATSTAAGYDLGGLSPAETTLYSRLGWLFWRGPLFIRAPQGPVPTPDDGVMILCLPQTPPLDLDQPLSAEWRAGELW